MTSTGGTLDGTGNGQRAAAADSPAAVAHHRTRVQARLRSAFGEEEREGAMLATKVRTVALLVVLVWQAVDNPHSGLAYAYALGLLSVFLLLGLAQYLCARERFNPPWLTYLFVAVDCALLTIVLMPANPFAQSEVPPSFALRGSNFVWYFMFLTQAAFSFRPRLVLWCGLCIVAARTATLFWVAGQPGVYTNIDLPERSVDALVKALFDPNFVYLGAWLSEVLASLLVAGGLALVVARSRRLVETRSRAERARASLARYFSPNVIDELSSGEDSVRPARDQDVAVLFADIIGFTRLCEFEPADNVVQRLREYYGVLARAVFDHDGTLDKYIGDGLMATFGTPRTGPHDASNALRCAVAMVEAIRSWNAGRIDAGKTPVRVGIGVHYGPAILGDIGDERRLEFAVIGDTVNIASRVEHMTRRLGAPLMISEDLVNAVRQEADNDAHLLDRFVDGGLQDIRGRKGQIRVLKLSAAAPS